MYLAVIPQTIFKHHRVSEVRAGAILVLACMLFSMFGALTAQAETRTLRMYYGHSKESATITFKKNGRYIKSGLRKANRFLRDWRRKEPTRMDPALLDLVWEVYQLSGSRKPIQVISGYRSPRTNNMLRRRGRKVARHSQHTKGKALDFFLPDVSVKKLRALGLKAHRGGVGYYRGSFVHLDTGKVRHWPRMSRRQLSRVFPRGKTIHIPSNGRPLRGYKVAMANLKKGLNANGRRRATKVRGSLLASIFKGGSGSRAEIEDGGVIATRQKRTKRKPAKKPPKAVAAVKPKAPIKPKARAKPAVAKPRGVDPFSGDAKRIAVARAKQAAEQKRKLKLAEIAANKAKAEVEKAKTLAAKTLAIAKAKKAAKVKEVALAKAKAAEELAKKAAAQIQIAKLAPAKNDALVVPTPRPNLRPSTTQLALAPVKDTGSLKPAVLTAPKATEVVLKSNKPTIAAVSTDDVEGLNSRTIALLARQRQLKAAQAKLTIPTPAAREKQPKEIIVAALEPKQTNPLSTPSWREEENKGTELSVPAPKLAPKVRSVEGAIALATGAREQMKSELSLGDLDGDTVKTWAVASTTRTGISARLQAPIYRRSTNRAAPASVFSAGFAFIRSPLRADRFSGRSLTRVAFAHFGQRN